LICLSHDELINHYRTNFLLQRYHKYSLTELENMMPWEREILLIMLLQTLEEEKKEREKAQRG
jgi:hypothetical protein